jgi:hypothetical protein
LSPFSIPKAVLGAALTFFGLVVTFEFVDTLSTISDPPVEYWGFPVTALATIVAFWLLVTIRNRQSLALRLGLIALLLSFPVFESIANVFFFDDVNPIRIIPFVGPIVNAFDLLSMPEFIDLYNVAFAAFPILILISIVVFLIPSSKKVSPERICHSCSFPAKASASFCGNCGAELESKTASSD